MSYIYIYTRPISCTVPLIIPCLLLGLWPPLSQTPIYPLLARTIRSRDSKTDKTPGHARIYHHRTQYAAGLFFYIYTKEFIFCSKEFIKLAPLPPHMGWLRLVGSLKSQASFSEYHLFYGALLQKRPVILRSLLIVANLQLLSHPSSLRMYIYTHTYTFLGACIYMQSHTHTCTQKVMSVSVYTSTWIYICACTRIHIYMCKCIHTWTCMHMWCKYVYIYTCTYGY